MPTPLGYPQPRATQFVADAELVTAPYGTDGVFSGNHIAGATIKRLFVNCYWDGSNYRAITTGYCMILTLSASSFTVYQSVGAVPAGTTFAPTQQTLIAGDISAIGTVVEGAPTQAKIMRLAASDVARLTSVGPWYNATTAYVQVATGTIPKGYGAAGTVRVKYDLRRESASVNSVYGRIKVNGTIVSGPTAISSQTYVTTTVDLTVSPGDVVTLEIADINSVHANAANFLLCATDTISFITKDAAWS